MNYKAIFFLTLTLFFFFGGIMTIQIAMSSSLAQSGGGGGGGGARGGTTDGFQSATKYGSFSELMIAITNYIFGLSFILAPLMLIIAGFYLVTAMGNEKQITAGKNIILYTLVGFLIIILAKGIIGLIQAQFGI